MDKYLLNRILPCIKKHISLLKDNQNFSIPNLIIEKYFEIRLHLKFLYSAGISDIFILVDTGNINAPKLVQINLLSIFKEISENKL